MYSFILGFQPQNDKLESSDDVKIKTKKERNNLDTILSLSSGVLPTHIFDTHYI